MGQRGGRREHTQLVSAPRAEVVHGCRPGRTASCATSAVVQLQVPHRVRGNRPGAVRVRGVISRVGETNPGVWLCSVFVDRGAVYHHVRGQPCRQRVSAAVPSHVFGQVLRADPASGNLHGRRPGAPAAAAK